MTERIPARVPSARTEHWLRLLAEQHGLLAVDQARTFGLTAGAIRAQVRAGRWRCVMPRVYATHTGPLPADARLAAALLYAGPWAVLSHRTAAERWGMCPPGDGPIHVTVPYQRSAISQRPLVVIHRSRATRHIAVDRLPPLTGRADTAIDLAVAQSDARAAQHVLVSLITERRVAAERVAERIAARPPYRYRHALEQALNRVRTGVESVLEELYAVDVEAAHGLPSALRQSPVEVDGRVLFEDAVYDQIGVPLTVRLNGRAHLQADIAERDRRRDNIAELAGRSRLVYGWAELSMRPCAAAREVAAVLRRYGWPGRITRCPRCDP